MTKMQKVLTVLGLCTIHVRPQSLVGKHAFSGQIATDGAKGIVKMSDRSVHLAPKLPQSFVRKAEGRERLQLDAGANDETLDKDARVAVLIRKQVISGQVAADGSIEITNDLVDVMPKLSPVRKATEGHVNAEGSIEISSALVDSRPSPVRRATEGQATADEIVEISNGVLDFASKPSLGIVRRAKKADPIEGKEANLVSDAALDHALETAALDMRSERHVMKEEADEDSNENRSSLESNGYSGAAETDALWSKFYSAASGKYNNSNISAWVLPDIVKYAGSKAISAGALPANTIQEEVRSKSSLIVNLHIGLLKMTVISPLNSLLMFLLLVSLLALLFFALSTLRKMMERANQRDRALEELRTAGQCAAEQLLLPKETGDWRRVLMKLRELRKDKFCKSHPLYTTIEAHMDEPGTQAQIQNTFSELSEGQQLLTAEKLNQLFTNLHFEIIDVTSGLSMKDSLIPADYMWLANCIEQPLTCSTLAGVFALFLLVVTQAHIIQLRGDGSTQSETGESVWPVKVEYSLEIRGHVVLCASFSHGFFQRLSSSLYFDSEVRVKKFLKKTSIDEDEVKEQAATEEKEAERKAPEDLSNVGCEEDSLSLLDENDAEAIAVAIEETGRRPSDISILTTSDA